MRSNAMLVGLFSMGVVAAVPAAELIHVRYNERPPYQVTAADGKVGGTVGRLAIQAFADAGIGFDVIQTPINRQIAILQENREMTCMMGWLSNPERRRIGKLTQPLAAGSLQGAITRADNEQMKDGVTVREILRNRSLRLLVKEHYFYGGALATAILRDPPPTVHTSAESGNMLQMLLHGRADYIFMAEEEAMSVIATPGSGLRPEQFRYVHFADIKDRFDRHLWCSRRVPDAVIERLNTAIERRQKMHGGAP